MKNVTWQDQINDKIIDIFLPLRTNDMYFFHKKSYSYQNKDRELQCKQSYHKFTIYVCGFIEDTISFLLNCVSVIVVHRLLKIT